MIEYKEIVNTDGISAATKKLKAAVARAKMIGTFNTRGIETKNSADEILALKENLARLTKEYEEEKALVEEYGLRSGLSKSDALAQLDDVGNELERVRVGRGMSENRVEKAKIEAEALKRIRNKILSK